MASCRRGSEGITSCYNGRKCVTDEGVPRTEKNGREKNTRRSGEAENVVRSGGDGRSEPIRGGEKKKTLSWQPAGQWPANKQARPPPTSSFHSDRTEHLRPCVTGGGKVSHCSTTATTTTTTTTATKEKVFVRNIQLFSPSCPAASAAAPLAQWHSLSRSVNKAVRVNLWASESGSDWNVNGFWWRRLAVRFLAAKVQRLALRQETNKQIKKKIPQKTKRHVNK